MLRSVKHFLKPLARKAVVPFLHDEPWRLIYNHYISAKLLPLEGEKDHYIVLKPSATTHSDTVNANLPVPPKDLWAGYGDTEEQYLTWGREDVSAMLNALKKAGASPELFTKVLDLGCASGRMLRFYPNQSDSSELWGVDVSAPMISWCQLHFPRPFLFATTTTFPHLPFEDNYFDLVYASSVFTHISDLADS
jgi:SAM-dependent methyltransferase